MSAAAVVRERPAERLRRESADALATPELLALVAGPGAARAWEDYDGSLRRLSQLETEELARIPGMGPATATKVLAALALGRRLAAEPANETGRIRSPADVFGRLGPKLRDAQQEEFWCLYLDTQSGVIRERCLTVGLLNSSLVHPREVFGPAIALRAASVVLAHNHPSGEPEPSPEDIAVTCQLVESGRLLGIPVRDHVIIGDRAFVSLRERGVC